MTDRPVPPSTRHGRVAPLGSPLPASDVFHPDQIAVTANRFANQYLAAAARLGLEAAPTPEAARTWMISGHGRRLAVRAAVLGCNNPLAIRTAADKYLTHLRLACHDIAMPAYTCLHAGSRRQWDAAMAKACHWARDRYPVVVKSTTGSGAQNVHADIDDEEALSSALRALRVARVGRFLVESQQRGTLYRVTVFDGGVVRAFAKFPGAVIGDGRATIRELVRATGARRRACGLSPIPLGRQVVRHLQKRGLELQSVLPAGTRQTLTAEISGRLGCRREPVASDALPDAARALFRRAARASGLRWTGFDYFCEDITDPASAHLGTFIELNSAPTPNEFVPGMTRTDYLAVATTVLARYFGLDHAERVAT